MVREGGPSSDRQMEGSSGRPLGKSMHAAATRINSPSPRPLAHEHKLQVITNCYICDGADDDGHLRLHGAI